MGSASIKIPYKLNTVLLICLQIFALFLLWAGSNLELAWSFPVGIVFSFLLLTNYALMHDAAHHVLHKNKVWNHVLGTIASWLFPMSFTLFEVTHHVHHRANRTDHEMFDYYYPDDNLFIKFGQWYSIMTGIYYPVIPIGSIIMAIAPWILHTKPFKLSKSSGILFDDFGKKEIMNVRFEVLFGIIFWVTIWHVLSLQWQPFLIMYTCFAFNWSTRQYVTHAWTPRDVMEGAANLKVTPLMGKILLNGQWDHVHHRYPYLPWTELANTKYHTQKPIGFWKQYLSLWLGPRANREKSPKVIMNIDVNPKGIFY